jgi:glutaredoxin 2
MITVYSKNHCPFCDKAKSLLKLKGIDYTEIKIDEDFESIILFDNPIILFYSLTDFKMTGSVVFPDYN